MESNETGLDELKILRERLERKMEHDIDELKIFIKKLGRNNKTVEWLKNVLNSEQFQQWVNPKVEVSFDSQELNDMVSAICTCTRSFNKDSDSPTTQRLDKLVEKLDKAHRNLY